MSDDFDVDESPFGKEMQVMMMPKIPTDSLTLFCAYQSNIVINLDPTQYHNPRRDASMLLAFIVNHLPPETWEHFTTELFTRYIGPHLMNMAEVQKAQAQVDDQDENVRVLSEKVKKIRKTKKIEIREDEE